MEDATGPQPTQKCSKSSCNMPVPVGKNRLCDKCREVQRLSKKRNRAKQKEKENETVSHKRPFTNDDTTDQPPKRSRAAGADDIDAEGVTTTSEDADDSYEDDLPTSPPGRHHVECHVECRALRESALKRVVDVPFALQSGRSMVPWLQGAIERVYPVGAG
ncbi:hypothetical protein NMY22_g5179 [Coprinellus aureogranulatus]|nr:hypothetical protein NMY22_g5179 [Coprinellus aureogranulatus]